jgi:peptide/nickel transport system permease protein
MMQSNPALAAEQGRDDLIATLQQSSVHAAPGIYGRAWRRFRQDPVAMASLGIVILIVLFVLAAPLISHFTGFTYSQNNLKYKLSKPMTHGFILGSDANGRDILTRLAYGGRISLMVSIIATFTLLGLGLGFGLVAGYAGGLVDGVIMRLVDVMLSLPQLPLLILVATLYAPTPAGLALIIAFTAWPGPARLIRGEVMALRKREYIEAARVVGTPPWRILIKHIVPNVTPIIAIQASLAVPGLILAESGLSFLGLGVRVPTPSWGNMLEEAARFYRTNWTNVFFPGLVIYLASLALYLVGIALRDALDPKLGD